MKGGWILLLCAFFLIPAVASAYMTWLTWRAGDDCRWLFGVFTLFFLLLASAPLMPKLKPKPEPPTASTHFVPHWFMLLAILVIVLSIFAAIVGAILRR